MTVTQVRLLSDGEELVIEEGHWQSPGSSELPPGEALFARRSQAISDGDRLVLRRQQARACRHPQRSATDRGHGNIVADTASQFVKTGQRVQLGESPTEATVERAGSKTDEGSALVAIIESLHVERNAPEVRTGIIR